MAQPTRRGGVANSEESSPKSPSLQTPAEGEKKKSLWDPVKHDEKVPLWLAPAKRDPRRPREVLVDNMWEAALARKAPCNLVTFREVLPRRYVNTVRAWRLLFDTNGSSRITFNEFGGNVRSLGYVGSIRTLWKELVPKGDEMSLKDLDPSVATKLESFRLWIRDHFETAEDAMKGMAQKGQTSINERSFCGKIKELGWLQSPEFVKAQSYPRTIHRWLDSEAIPTGFITVKDLEWLGLFDTGCGKTTTPRKSLGKGLLKGRNDDDSASTDTDEAEARRKKPIITGLTINGYTVTPLIGPLANAFGQDEVTYTTRLPDFHWPQ